MATLDGYMLTRNRHYLHLSIRLVATALLTSVLNLATRKNTLLNLTLLSTTRRLPLLFNMRPINRFE